LWREKKFEIALVGNAVDQSIKTFNMVREHIENNTFLKHLIPENRSSAWTKQVITTSNGNKYYVKPFNSSTRGTHVDLLICDDLLREENMSQEDIKEMFWSVLFPTVRTRDGQIVVIGTPQTSNDLLSELEDKKNWANTRKQAVIMDKEGKWKAPLWKERFTLEDLKDAEEHMGTFRFNRELLCQPVGLGAQVYPPEMVLECTKDNLKYSYDTKGYVYIGADFAMSGSKYGDYSVFTVIDSYFDEKKEFGTQDPIVIKKMERYKGLSFEEQKGRLVDLYNLYSATACIIDVSGVGQAFYDDLLNEQVNVFDKKFDARSRNRYLIVLRKIIEQTRLVIPFNQNDMDAYQNSSVLLRELTEMESRQTPTGIENIQSTGAHDDTVMSVALAVSEVGIQKPIKVTMEF
jgi:hypothetical protein